MKREILNIDEEQCNGCGNCVPTCHEGALQVIDGKVRLISDLLCDGLGACIGHCPKGAITIEQRECEPYDEIKVMGIMVTKGLNTVVAHLKHLKEHDEMVSLKQGLNFLNQNPHLCDFKMEEVKMALYQPTPEEKSFHPEGTKMNFNSELRQWPVQLHLINPAASCFKNADLLVAADCTAFTLGDFHRKWLKGKSLVIACPKLDQGKEIYLQKFISLMNSGIKSITVLIMEVPCCGGLLNLVEKALERSAAKIQVNAVTVSIKGEILNEEGI